MTPIRKRIAARLFRQTEHGHADHLQRDRYGNCMACAPAIRRLFQKATNFLGFAYPGLRRLSRNFEVNAFIEGDDIIYHHYQHTVAVGAEHQRAGNPAWKAVLPDRKAIPDFRPKSRKPPCPLLILKDLHREQRRVYGSLLSTRFSICPRAAFGHAQDRKRPVVIDDQIVIRPKMYGFELRSQTWTAPGQSPALSASRIENRNGLPSQSWQQTNPMICHHRLRPWRLRGVWAAQLGLKPPVSKGAPALATAQRGCIRKALLTPANIFIWPASVLRARHPASAHHPDLSAMMRRRPSGGGVNENV
jgi:hypothetical protein